MDYGKPAAVAEAMIEAGTTKLGVAPRNLFIRGMLSGAILGVSISPAFTGAMTTGQPISSALIFWSAWCRLPCYRCPGSKAAARCARCLLTSSGYSSAISRAA